MLLTVTTACCGHCGVWAIDARGITNITVPCGTEEPTKIDCGRIDFGAGPWINAAEISPDGATGNIWHMMGGLAVESGEMEEDLEGILSLENLLLLFKHVSNAVLDV